MTDKERDPEIDALERVAEAFDKLKPEQVRRVLKFALDRAGVKFSDFGIEGTESPKPPILAPTHRDLHGLSVAAVGKKLGAKKGPAFVIAACAHLTIVQGKTTFSREDILTTLKEDTGEFKPSFSVNLTRTLQNLVADDSLRQPSAGKYALSSSKRSEVEAALGSTK